MKSAYWGATADDYSLESMQTMRDRNKSTLNPVQIDLEEEYHSLVSDVENENVGKIEKDITEIIIGDFDSDSVDNDVRDIPSADEIMRIKSKKDLLRRIGVPSVSTDSTSSYDIIPVKKDGNRFVREEDEVDDGYFENDNDGFFQSRTPTLSFGDPGKKYNTNNIKDDIDDTENGIDEEFLLWEALQLKKLGIQENEVVQEKALENALESLEEDTTFPTIFRTLNISVKNMKEKSLALEGRLNEKRTRTHAQKMALERLEHDESRLSGQIQFFHDTKEYILDLLDCLDVKNFEILGLEEKITMSAIKVSDAKRLLRKIRIENERSDVLAVMHKQMTNEQIQLSPHYIEREQRKNRMIEESGGHAILYGYDSDDEEVEELKEYENELHSVRGIAETLFTDVHDDFSAIEPIKEMFEEWKYNYKKDYDNIYCSKCLPVIFSPFVKREVLLKWNMLQMDSLEFSDMEWWNELLNFGSENAVEGDKDLTLVPVLIARSVMDRIVILISNIYNPFSHTETRDCTYIFEQLQDYEGVKSMKKELMKLYTVLTVTIEQAINSIEFIRPTSSQEIPSLQEYNDMQAWRAIKLFENILYWVRYLPKNTIRPSMISNLLNSKILPQIKNSEAERFIQKIEKIVNALDNPNLNLKEINWLAILIDIISQRISKLENTETALANRYNYILTQLTNSTEKVN